MLLLLGLALLCACERDTWPPGVREVPQESPVLSPAEALRTFALPPGYRIELVAAEPLVQDPVALDFDADGRLYVVEMRGYMPNVAAEGEGQPVGRIVVLEDRSGDGRMDHRTVYLDSLVLPRAVKVLDHGVLVAAPPFLWLTRDTTGDLRADTREVVRDDYGDPASNPEHNANGLLWGLDNWIHSAQYDGQLRVQGRRFEHRPSPRLGQWGLSTDDYGRIYRNFNESPLHADLVPAHYLGRNPVLTRPRGAYELLAENGPVWPIRPTPGVNRGYREGILRADGSLAQFTAAGSPVVYRGDRLPQELRGNVFVSEPAGNLVRRYVVTEGADGRLSAHNPYEGAEFLASTDERFRPVNLYSAPDGTLLVVDMYRGVIQHRDFLTDYLVEQIRERGLEEPLGLGRIYRIVHRSTRRDRPPRLSGSEPEELVALLSHPNGWWRSKAQQLLVERGDRRAAPSLRRLALSAGDERTRLHALWTLEGLGEADPPTLERALSDGSPQVRAAALRIAEPYLAGGEHPLRAAVLQRLQDPAPAVRWQLAASLGELPAPERAARLVELLARYGDDPILVDVAISGLAGHELPVLEQLLARAAAEREPAVTRLAATVTRAGQGGDLARMLEWIGDEARPRWQRLALLAGFAEVVPDPAAQGVSALRLDSRPAGLLAAASSSDAEVRSRAQRIARLVDWPGNPDPPLRAAVRPLSPEEQQLFQAGRQHYQTACASCHQENGMGMPGLAARLVGSAWVLGDPGRLIRIVLQGKEGEMLMPPMGGTLSEEEVAAVLTYIRREWGHHASPVSPAQVREVRGYTAGRTRPWTEEELANVRR